jgi:hypothetical protein
MKLLRKWRFFNSPKRQRGHGGAPRWRFGLVGALLVLLAPAPASAAKVLGLATFASKDMILSPEVVVDRDGSVRLARSQLIADEIGATDFHQTETLSDRVQAKKVFLLDRAEAASAELFIFHGPKQVHVNGKALEKGERLASTGWARWKVPPELLKLGANEVVLSGGGSLLLEPSGRPGRSFKSTDGGKTWSEQLGKNDDQRGEYLVRLRLGQCPSAGWAMTPVLDLWDPQGTGIARPGKLIALPYPIPYPDIPIAGAHVVPWVRTGSTPVPDAKTWTDWLPFPPNPPDVPHPYKPAEKNARHRWAQLRFVLPCSAPGQRLGSRLEIKFTFEPDAASDRSNISITAAGGPRILQGSTPFVYQEPSPRLKLLRERYQLDKVIAPGKTELEQLMLLRYWVRNQWHSAWGSNNAAWMPPWDALIILEAKDQADCLTMCTHYAAVFTQCCLALGWNARHCILDHHCVSEVYVNQHNKWVMMDAGNSKERADVGLHFERGGVPLSALELHLAYTTGKTDGIQVCFTPAALAEKIAPLCRPAPPSSPAGGEGRVRGDRPDTIPLADLGKYPVCQIENYRRYAFPPRNNYLSSLLPGELYQGWSEYFYDGYCWVGDSPDDPKISPEYSRHLSPARPQDIDWSLNWTRIHLARTAKAGELQVDLETHTPNLARLERWEDGAWKPVGAAFVWRLKPGENELRVRSVNRWDRPGAEAKVQVKWAP